MASKIVSDYTEDTVTVDAVSDGKQQENNMEDRLGTLSEKINLCNTVLNDLKDLTDVLKRKSLQDVSLPLQK